MVEGYESYGEFPKTLPQEMDQATAQDRFENLGLRVIDGGANTNSPDSETQPGTSIADWPEPKLHYEKGIGTVSTRTILLEDGSRFMLKAVVPARQRWNISVDFMPPLGTEIDGYNTYLGYKLAQAGIHSRIIGTNKANGRSILHDAGAALAILKEDDRQHAPNPSCEPARSLSLGYSMGLMKALALTGLAASNGRTVDLTLGMDPGPAEKVPYTFKELPEFALWLTQQGLEIPKIFMESWQETSLPKTLARSRRLLPTASADPRSWFNTLDKLHTIASGGIKESLARINPEAAMVMHFFIKNRYNQEAVYRKTLGKHHNVRFVREDGVHLAGGYMSTIRALVAKTAHGLELIEQNVNPGDLSAALDYPILRRT